MVRELRQRQRLKQMLYSWPSIALLLIVTFLLVKGAVNLMIKERQTASIVGSLTEGRLALEEREAELEGRIARLQTEEGIVEEIREKFSVTREGERIALIVDEKSSEKKEKIEKIWWKSIWDAMIRIYTNVIE